MSSLVIMKEKRKWSNAKPQNLYAGVAKATLAAGRTIGKEAVQEQRRTISYMDILKQSNDQCMALIKESKPYNEKLFKQIDKNHKKRILAEQRTEMIGESTMKVLENAAKVFDTSKGKALDRAREIKHEQKQKKWRKRRKAR